MVFCTVFLVFMFLCYFYKIALLETTPFVLFGVEIDLTAVRGLLHALCFGYPVAHQRAERLTQRAVCFLEIELNYFLIQ